MRHREARTLMRQRGAADTTDLEHGNGYHWQRTSNCRGAIMVHLEWCQ